MKFSCENCGAKFQIADDKIGPRGAKVRCRRCDETIFLSAPAPDEAPADTDDAESADAVSPQPDLEGAAAEAADVEPHRDEPEADGFESGADTESGAPTASPGLPSIDVGLGSMDVGAFEEDATNDESAVGLAPDASWSAEGAEALPLPGDPEPEPAAERSESGAGDADTPANGSDGLEELRERNELLEMQASLQAELAQGLDLEVPERHDPGQAAFELGSAFEAMFGAEGLEGDRVPTSSSGGVDPAADPADPAAEPAEWFVAIRDEQVGPLTRAELEERWNAAEISPATLSWKRGLAGWVPIAQIEELASLPGFARRLTEVDADSEDLSYEGFPNIARPTSAAAAPASEDESAPAWKPSAASALDSLAEEELAEARTTASATPDLASPSPSPFSAGPSAAPPAASARFTDEPFGTSEAPVPAPAAGPTFPPAATTALPPRRSRPWLWAAPVALVLLLGGGAAAYSLWGSGGGADERITAYEPREAAPSDDPGAGALAAATDAGPSADASSDAIAAGATEPADAGTGSDARGAQLVQEAAEPDREEPEARQARRAPKPRAERPRRRAAPRKRTTARSSRTAEDDLLGSHGTGVPEKLSAEEVKRVLRNNAEDVKRCVAIQAKADPSVRGQLTVQMVLPGDGRPRRVTVVPAQFRDAPVGQCLIRSVSAWRFPRFSGSAVPVKFPVFVRGG